MDTQIKNRLLVRLSFMALLAILGLITKVSAQTSPQIKIKEEDKVYSDAFKAQVNQNRFAAFQQIETLIKPASAFEGMVEPTDNYFIGDYKMNSNQLIELLGEPDRKIAPVIWQYNLKPDGCMALIGLDEEGYITYMVLKECR